MLTEEGTWLPLPTKLVIVSRSMCVYMAIRSECQDVVVTARNIHYCCPLERF